MNRTTVQLAVLAAVGLANVARAGIPDGPIPEVTDETTEAPKPDAGSMAEVVRERWKSVHRPWVLANAPDGAKLARWIEDQLDAVPSHTGLPIPAKQRTRDGWADLSTKEGRADSVLACLSAGSELAECSLNGVMSAEQAAAKAGLTVRTETPPWLDEQFRWNELAGVCANPEWLGGCGGVQYVDARTGQCYRETMCKRGRPFEDGRVARLEGDVRTAAGEAWARVALDEHASVASFARHVLELLAVGAPPDLLAAASQAQLDEVRHAALALDLARRFGAEVAFGPMDTDVPVRSDLFALLKSVAEDGCIGETVSAVECAIALEQTEDPAVRAVLEAIVADEAAHAALAWRTLAWGLPKLAPAERAEVLAVFRDARVGPAPAVPPGIGVLGGEEAAHARQWALSGVVAPALAELVA
ncbi:MAG: hypothetical protein H6737_30585 [Alphaproteobacteria bacterium]|nr:hypothetical protein [Alphaproteobacteria bacterium]